jgi:hypothetical protein
VMVARKILSYEARDVKKVAAIYISPLLKSLS